MPSTFKIATRDSMCAYEIDEGSYGNWKRKDDSENYFVTVETHENEEWKDILVRKYKRGVFKITSKLGVEVTPSIETAEEPFSLKGKNY